MGKLDAIFKLSIIGSVLLASCSVGYYYLAYLPHRDAQLDFERRMERAQADDLRHAEQGRALADQERARADQRALEQRQLAEKAAIKLRYDNCMLDAEGDYSNAWAAKCNALREVLAKQHADCIADRFMTKAICDESHKVPDASASCKLPHTIAVDVQDRWDKSRNRCLQESMAGLQ